MRILRIGLIMVAASLAGLQVSAEETKPFAAADQTETASAEPQADCLEEKSGDLIYCAQADDEIDETEDEFIPDDLDQEQPSELDAEGLLEPLQQH